MNEPVIHFMHDGTEIQFRQVTMAEAIELDSAIWQRERQALKDMLDDAKATPEQRIAELKEHYERRGLATEMTRQLFRVTHARNLLFSQAVGNAKEYVDKLAPNVLTSLALKCVGYELPDEVDEEIEGKQQPNQPEQP